MGPVRARLIAALALLVPVLIPAPALAEVCDKLRPGWEPGSAPVGWLGETLFIFTSPPGLLLLALFALAMWRGWRWLLVIVTLAAVALAFLLYTGNGAEMAVAARIEGCIGSQSPAAALSLLLGVLAFLRFWRRLG